MTRDSAAAEDATVPTPSPDYARTSSPQAGKHPVNHYSLQLVEQNLDALATHCQGNPDYLLSIAQYPRIAIESPSAAGGKFWIGTAMETGLSIRWGRLGTAGTVKHIALRLCDRQNSVLELKKRALQKILKGYDIIPQQTFLP